MDLFEYTRQLNADKTAPLAARMRPEALDEFVGQKHIIGKGKMIWKKKHLRKAMYMKVMSLI